MTPGASHRWAAPAARDLVAWPAAFGRRFAIFVDTEEEFDWAAPFSREAISVETIAALPAMHRRFVDRSIAPIYLADFPVLADARAADNLRGLASDGRTEIGAQLHPWVTPPHDEPISCENSFAGNLPVALEAAKLDALTAAVVSVAGRAPRAFRAGRYGLGPATLRLLSARGYRLDTSMRARFDYRAEGGPDFSAIGGHAFRPTESGLIEVPPTTVMTGMLRRLGPSLYRALGSVPHGRGALARSRLLSRVPLTPEGVPVAEACEAVRVALGEGVRVLNFSFHSPSLVPGNTPYVRDAADVARFHRWWDAILDLLERESVRPASLDELLHAAG